MILGSFRVRKFTLLFISGLLLTSARLQAAPWLPLGPDGGDARRIVPDPHDHAHLYLGTANGWIYESHTSGASWVRLAQIGNRDDLVLDSIVVDQSDPKHLIVGAWVIDHPDGGLFISMDGGHTWLNQAEMRGQSVRALSASPSDSKTYVAGTLSGVFRSVDSGWHWSQISPAGSNEIHEIQSVAVDPKNPSVIYAGTWHLPWKTTDAGAHWASMKQGIIDDSDVFSIIVDPISPETVYASACSGIYKSEDSGVLFHKIQGIPSTARRTRVLLQDPDRLETVFAGTTEGLFRSNDAGATWTRTTGPEIVVNDVSVDIGDRRHVLIATNRGGVLSSDDGGDTFHSSNGGFSARQITALQRDAAHSSTLYVGVVNDKDWGGVFESENGGLNWMQRSEGLQGRDVFSLGQAPDGTMIAGTAHGLYRLSGADTMWLRVENVPSLPLSTSSTSSIFGSGRSAPSGSPGLVVQHRTVPTPKHGSGYIARRKSLALKAATPSSGSTRSAASSKGVKKRVSSKGTQLIPSSRYLRPVQHKPVAVVTAPTPLRVDAPKAPQASFDGAVYSITTAGNAVLAATSSGLLSSRDNGLSWAGTGPTDHADWHLLASAKSNVIAGALHALVFSADAGASWSPVRVPDGLTQVTALAVEPSGTIWVGSREGVFISSDAGKTWSTPENLYASPVTSIVYDDATAAVTVATAGPHGIVFTVRLPQKSVSYFESGWTLRFAYPLGDHLVAATLFDGLVVQPRMTVLPSSKTPSTSSSGSVESRFAPER